MKTNLVLIGMTGCGKTSIGEQLSRQLELPFRDVDLFIEQITQQSIPELFEVSEAHFRAIETTACEMLAEKETHTIISCGGGVVLNPENITALSQTGWIVFIDRPVEQIIEDIEVEHRPLLKNGKNYLYRLYEERIGLYRTAADFSVENRSTMDEVLHDIKECLPKTITYKRSR